MPSGCLTAACPSLTRVIIIHLQFIKGSLSSDFLKNCKDVKPNFEAIILFMKRFPCLRSYLLKKMMKVKTKTNSSSKMWLSSEYLFIFYFHPPGYSVAAQARNLVREKKITYLKKFGFTFIPGGTSILDHRVQYIPNKLLLFWK